MVLNQRRQSILLGAKRPDLQKDETLADVFQDIAKQLPHHTALVFHKEKISYEQLESWSNKIAFVLKQKGLEQGNFIGVWLPRGLALHATILGIVKSGAAYVPLDFEMPFERVANVMQQINASACFTLRPDILPCEMLDIIPLESNIEVIRENRSFSPDSVAYVLFTSGTTGQPKGIPITHRQICHLIRAEQSIFNILPTDKVYQGFSVSFDMWCEETWISYLVGATLWVADAITAKAVDELEGVLNDAEITVLHVVPSILGIMGNDIPLLRLINTGGEACTPNVVERWATPQHKLFNSYGPTETTVSATIAELHKNEPITIGLPLPNYSVAVISEDLNLVGIGQPGELVVAGAGVANGYINLPLETKEKFIDKPLSLDILPGKKIYRTGDKVIMDENGKIAFHGRIDNQIKLRGYRIELDEIEDCLSKQINVAAAAVTLVKDSNEQDQLVAFIVADIEDAKIDVALIKKNLAKNLPAYMVPAEIVVVKEMPRLPSGKINRKALPSLAIINKKTSHTNQKININAPIPNRVIELLQQIFPNKIPSLNDDFFDDLGGHSLLAAVFVSRLRQEANVPQASLRDIYQHRPIQKLVDCWQAKNEEKIRTRPTDEILPVGNFRYYACFLAQTVTLLVIFSLFAAQIFLPYLAYYYMLQKTDNFAIGTATAFVTFCVIPPFVMVFGIIVKWLIIGIYKEGDYPLWGSYYFRWWLVRTLRKLTMIDYLNGTTLYPLYLRLMGMKIAADAQIGAFNVGVIDLVSIGKNVSIGSNVILDNAFIENGWLKIRSITIGDNAYIGSGTVIAGDNHIPKNAEVKDLSFLRPHAPIKENEIWQGSPAQLISKKEAAIAEPVVVKRKTIILYNAIYSSLLFVFPLIMLLPLLPNIIALVSLDDAAADYDFSYLIISPVLAFLYIVLYIALTATITRILSKKVKEGNYSIYSRAYLAKWFTDQAQAMALFVLHPVFATVFISSLYRLFGAKIGKNTEISTASQVTHCLLNIGNDAFIADAVMLGESEVRDQQLTLLPTVIHANSFVGNSALIPQGYNLPPNILIGVLSIPPDAAALEKYPANDWFGSPAMALPKRQESGNYPIGLTFQPSWKRKLARAAIETCRILLPTSVILCLSVLFVGYGQDLILNNPWPTIMAYFPFYYLGIIGIPAFLIAVCLKWLMVGRYGKRQVPMWTSFVWRTEAVTSTYETLAVPFLLDYLAGTAWLPWALRCMGMKIGKKAWLNTTDFTEFDLVTLGNQVALNEECGPQTHLFEDRIMKTGPIIIGSGSTIGSRSIVLYDAIIGENTVIDALSLVMKGEEIPGNTQWCGSPVRLSE